MPSSGARAARAGLRLVWLAVLRAMAAAVLGLVLLPVMALAQQDRAREAIVLDINDAIGPATLEYLEQGMEEAERRRASLLILRIDTPGGLDTVMRQIIRRILASPIPVACYVSPSGARAASAGTFILYACHVAAMAPGTNLGAATPVAIGGGGGGAPPASPSPGEKPGQEGEGKGTQGGGVLEPERAKATNDAVAYIRSLADLRGRNADWAERAVREAASLPARAALEQKVIDIVARDMADLMAQMNGQEVLVGQTRLTLATQDLRLVEMPPDWRTQFLAAITNPNIAYLLLMVGLYGLIFEFLSPGTFAPGVIGGLCLLVGLFALNLLPINTAGVLLLLAGVALLVAEVFAASFGILGVGGIAAIAIGSLLMFRGEVPGFTLAPGIVLAVTAMSGAFLLLILKVGWQAHRRRAATGDPALRSMAGVVLYWEGDRGEVHVHGENWQARAAGLSGCALMPGQAVRVTGRDGLILTVEPVNGAAPEAGGGQGSGMGGTAPPSDGRP